MKGGDLGEEQPIEAWTPCAHQSSNKCHRGNEKASWLLEFLEWAAAPMPDYQVAARESTALLEHFGEPASSTGTDTAESESERRGSAGTGRRSRPEGNVMQMGAFCMRPAILARMKPLLLLLSALEISAASFRPRRIAAGVRSV
jgi:hypothetical protein